MLSALNKKWVFANAESETVKRLVEEQGLSVLLAQLMVNRGLGDPDTARFFLDAQLDTVHDPFLMLGMDVAVKRIVQAIQNKETVTVYGDYDVDGVTSAALVVHFFGSWAHRLIIISPTEWKKAMASTIRHWKPSRSAAVNW